MAKPLFIKTVAKLYFAVAKVLSFALVPINTALVPVSFIFATYYKMYYFIIHAAKTCCIEFISYGETFVYQNCDKIVLCRGKSAFVCTSADKLQNVLFCR